VEQKVVRNNEITADEARALNPERILISPGPCSPAQAGNSLAIIDAFKGKAPILGVCLGHQCIGEFFGGKIIRAGRIMHGKLSPIHHDGKDLFQDLPQDFQATRYHSLVIAKDTNPECLEVTATSDDDEIMGIRHKELPIWGVQFHPESIAAEHGMQLLRNFINLKAN
jgi:anthranilate synthase/aminodeoxychorismate synthase-like glutamine amidotransferase